MNNKKKGNRGELEIAKLLTKITGTDWKRVPASGALFTTKTHEMFKGDVYTLDPEYKGVVVEVKNWKGKISINDMYNDNSRFNKAIIQTVNESYNSECGLFFFKSGGKWFWTNIRRGDSNIVDCLMSDSTRVIGDYWKLEINKDDI